MRRGHDPLATAPGARSAGEEVETLDKAGDGAAGPRSRGVSHMTCKDFQRAWEGGGGRRTDVLSQSAEMAVHARACPECCGLVRDEHLLEKHLDLVRAAVPPVPPSLDSAVLGNY